MPLGGQQQHFPVADDDGKQIIEIVRDPACQPPHRLHFHGLVELIAGSPEIVDVGADAKPAQNVAAVVTHGKPAGEKPTVFAFTATDAVLGFIDRAGPNGVGPSGGGFGGVLVMQRRGPLPAHGLCGGEPCVVVPALIAIIPAAFGIGGEDKLRNRVGEKAVASLAFAEGIFGAALFGDIPEHHDGAARVVGGPEDG